MADKWFRLYNSFFTDLNVQSLSFENQRHLLAIYSLRSSGQIDGASDAQISKFLGISSKKFQNFKKILKSLGLLTDNNQIPTWGKRQFKSDSSKERTRKWRQQRDVTVTPPDTDTETDTEEKEKTQKKEKISEPNSDIALRVLNFLNLKCNKNFKAHPDILAPILNRLKDGATQEECELIILQKRKEWGDHEKRSIWLRPKTLFGDNFQTYLGEITTQADRQRQNLQKQKARDSFLEEQERLITQCAHVDHLGRRCANHGTVLKKPESGDHGPCFYCQEHAKFHELAIVRAPPRRVSQIAVVHH